MVSAVGQVRCSPSFAVPRAENVRKGKPNILERIVRTAEEKRVDWTTKAVRSLTKAELKLDKHFPGLPLQQKIDDLGLRLEKLFAPLRNANAWLDSNGEGKWYRQLAVFLAKLPLRVARNVLHLLYEIVKGAVFFAVHPVKSVLRLAKLTVRLLSELMRPEAWAVIGAGAIGSCCGQAIISGTPFPLLGIIIGGALVVGGVSLGGFKAALLAEKGQKLHAIKENLVTQCKNLPEAALTGFLLGLAIGGIQRALYAQKMQTWRVENLDQAKEFVEKYLAEHNLPPCSQVGPDLWEGKIFVQWDYTTIEPWLNSRPDLFSGFNLHEGTQFSIIMDPTTKTMGIDGLWMVGMDSPFDYAFIAADKLGLAGRAYPLPPPVAGTTVVSTLGPMGVGALHSLQKASVEQPEQT